MIKKTRRRFISLIMSVLGVAFLLILVLFIVFNVYSNLRQDRKQFRSFVRTLDVETFCDPDTDSPHLEDLEYATVLLPKDQKGVKIYVNRLSQVSDEKLKKITFNTSRSLGNFVLSPLMVYTSRYTHEGQLIIFRRSVLAQEGLRSILTLSIFLFILGMGLLYLLSRYLSRWIIAPMEDAYDSQKTFLSNASHELKTPLTIIRSNAILLESDPDQKDAVRFILQETRHMSALLDQMLTLQRLETPTAMENYATFDLAEAAAEMVLPFESVAFEHGVTLNMELNPNHPPMIFGNRNHIQQLISILLDNAICHTPAGGEITVSIPKNKNGLSVANTGEPIPEDRREKIFERFYRADASRNDTEHRYGLGLSIAQTIAQNHKGSIHVDCRNGVTTFTLILPQKESERR